MTDREILRLDSVWAGYGSGHVLQGASLALGRGEVTGIIGRNGVGKTTLVRTIMGQIQGRGTIVLNGTDIISKPAHVRARLGIGYVPQGRGLFKQMTVEENLSTGLRIGSDLPARDGLLDTLHELFPILKSRRRQLVGSMSGGEQQQVAIARALAARPELLILDEPSEGIQPSIVQHIATALIDLNKAFGTTVLVVEQNIDLLVSLSLGKCYVIEKGTVTHSLLPENRFTRDQLCSFLEFN